jgi:outer membrane protein assembly factor BamB
MRPPTRRAVLRLAGLGLTGLAGCASRGGGSSTAADSPTRPPTATPTEPSADTGTYGPTDGPDERLTATPPGDPPLSPSGSWPQYRFDAGNTGYASDVAGLRSATGYWALDAGRAPSVADGTLFNVHARDDPKSFTRRDPSTAAVRSATDLVSYAVNSPPAVADDRAFVTTFVEVFCLAADGDELLWRGPEMDGIHGAPTVAGDALLVNSGGFSGGSPRLAAFDFDGTLRWSYAAAADSHSTPAVGDGAVVVATGEGVHAVELDTGAERFTTDVVGDRWADVVVSGGTAFVAGRADDGDGTKRLYALDADDGSVRWHADTGRGAGPPVVADGVVSLLDADETLVALDTEDGSEVRSFGRRAVPRARTGDVLYATSGGSLYAYDAATGDGLWSYRTPEVRVADTVNRDIYGITPVEGAVYVDAADGLHGVGPAE